MVQLGHKGLESACTRVALPLVNKILEYDMSSLSSVQLLVATDPGFATRVVHTIGYHYCCSLASLLVLAQLAV